MKKPTAPKPHAATAELTRLRAAWARGGQAGTPAQNRARRQNARAAGRPKRVCIYCGQPVSGGHTKRALDVSCGAHGWRWQRRSEDARPAIAPDPQLLADVLAALVALPFPDRQHRRLVARLRVALQATAPKE